MEISNLWVSKLTASMDMLCVGLLFWRWLSFQMMNWYLYLGFGYFGLFVQGIWSIDYWWANQQQYFVKPYNIPIKNTSYTSIHASVFFVKLLQIYRIPLYMGMLQRTLVILKPESISHGHMWEIISRFERVGLEIIAAKLINASREIAWLHYPHDRTEFIAGMWNRSIDNYKEYWLDIVQDFGTEHPHEIWLSIRDRLIDMLTQSRIFIMVLEWYHAIEIVRKMIGHTVPVKAAPGTIRWDYSTDSAYTATMEKRPIRNLIHASGTPEEADYEINLWFKGEL